MNIRLRNTIFEPANPVINNLLYFRIENKNFCALKIFAFLKNPLCNSSFVYALLITLMLYITMYPL